MFKILLAIGTGSFIGGVARYITGRAIQMSIDSAFPLGTLVVNMTGCFFIGVLFGMTEKGQLMNSEWRLFLTVGLCGGFTTFSTYTLENMALLKDGNLLYFFSYTSVSVLFGLACTWVGYFTTKLI